MPSSTKGDRGRAQLAEPREQLRRSTDCEPGGALNALAFANRERGDFTARHRDGSAAGGGQRAMSRAELEGTRDAALPRSGLQTALELKLRARLTRWKRQAQRDDLTLRCAARTSSACSTSKPGAAAAAHHRFCSSRSRPPSWAARSTSNSSPPRPGRPGSAGEEHRVAASRYGCRGRDRPLNREIAALGAVNLAALDELTAACASARPSSTPQNADLRRR